MSKEEIKAIYEMAKGIYEGTCDAKVCCEIVYGKYGTSQQSFRNWFIPLFRYLLEGKTFKGAVRQELMEHYLKRIYDDYGEETLRNALQSYKGTIDYYAERGKNKPGDRKIYERFANILSEVEAHYSIDDELDEVKTSDVEGLRKSVFVNVYERSAEARRKCIQNMGCVCAVCGFDFEKVYGELGKGFIHVHHKIPVSSIGEAYTVNYETDLLPVCPNCHAMLHRKKSGKVFSVEELKDIIKRMV